MAVGPGGLLVVETKWRAEPWFTEERSVAQHVRQQADKIELLLRNRDCLVPVRPVVVLWHTPAKKDPSPVDVVDGVSVVDGAHLRSWIRSLPATEIGGAAAVRAWDLLADSAEARDAHQEVRTSPAPRTCSALLWLVLSYLVTGFGGLLTACLAAELGSWKGMVTATAVGLAPIPLSLRHRLRRYVWTWTGSVALLILAETVVIVGHRV